MSRRVMERFVYFIDNRVGAPIDITPLKDDPKLGADVSRNDNFRFDTNSQERCPFAAHIRKTNPRSDLPSTEIRRILRQGIAFGPEVSANEKQQKTTEQARGLLFACYQSSIPNGFEFIQKCKSFQFLMTHSEP